MPEIEGMKKEEFDELSYVFKDEKSQSKALHYQIRIPESWKAGDNQALLNLEENKDVLMDMGRVL